MSAQATERISAAPTTSAYGATTTGEVRPNGVVPAVVTTASSTAGNGGSGMLGNPNLHDLPPDVAPQPVSEATTSTELRPDVAEPHYGEPDRSANVITEGARANPATPERSRHQPVMQTPPVPPATMRVQEFYTAESTASTTEERNVRWTARFTEFMRIAASRI